MLYISPIILFCKILDRTVDCTPFGRVKKKTIKTVDLLARNRDIVKVDRTTDCPVTVPDSIKWDATTMTHYRHYIFLWI